MRQSRQQHSRPGRRAGRDRDAVRRSLLDAARRCFSRKAFSAVPVRELAQAARVTPAMIHYYFGSKAGLYLALFDEAVGPVLAQLEETAATGEGLEDVMSRFTRALARHPWIPPLLLRDVYSGDSPIRAAFIERFAGRAAPLLARTIREAQSDGRLRTEVEPRLAVLSLLGLCVFPFLAAGIAGAVLELEYDDATVEALIRHNAKLLQEGLWA